MKQDIIDCVFSAGVIGQGGAGFPSHTKLMGTFDTLILNGAECEPLLRTDRYIMLKHAAEIVRTALTLAETLCLNKCILGVKASYKKEIESLTKAKDEFYPALEFCLLDAYYPAGDEHTLVYEATGKVIPPGGLPLDQGCVVLNIGTLYSISKAILGIPLTEKYITVTGEVKTPCIMQVPIGASIADCITKAGSSTVSPYVYVKGGPMMGTVLQEEQAAEDIITKTTSGIIVLSADSFLANYGKTSLREISNRSKAACIQCRMCTDLCPRYLLGHPLEPHRIMRVFGMSASIEEALQQECVKNSVLCCECGICELIACPMGIHPRTVNIYFKNYLKNKKTLSSTKALPVNSMRNYRKIPSLKAAYSTETKNWYDLELLDCVHLTPEKVVLPLKQSVGKAAIPIIKSGSVVNKNDLIAYCPEECLGSNLHASISGIAIVNKDSITINIETQQEARIDEAYRK